LDLEFAQLLLLLLLLLAVSLLVFALLVFVWDVLSDVVVVVEML
jgi:uncharacterized membrane protein